MIKAALDKKADVLITGDIGHHEGIDAVAQGLAVIDAGHYGIEHIFMEDMRQYLGSHLTDVEVMGLRSYIHLQSCSRKEIKEKRRL